MFVSTFIVTVVFVGWSALVSAVDQHSMTFYVIQNGKIPIKWNQTTEELSCSFKDCMFPWVLDRQELYIGPLYTTGWVFYSWWTFPAAWWRPLSVTFSLSNCYKACQLTGTQFVVIVAMEKAPHYDSTTFCLLILCKNFVLQGKGKALFKRCYCGPR
jgi:hypothetical protein